MFTYCFRKHICNILWHWNIIRSHRRRAILIFKPGLGNFATLQRCWSYMVELFCQHLFEDALVRLPCTNVCDSMVAHSFLPMIFRKIIFLLGSSFFRKFMTEYILSERLNDSEVACWTSFLDIISIPSNYNCHIWRLGLQFHCIVLRHFLLSFISRFIRWYSVWHFLSSFFPIWDVRQWFKRFSLTWGLLNIISSML